MQNKSAEKNQESLFPNVFSSTDTLVTISPLPQDDVYDGHSAMGAVVLIGFVGHKPVYRTTHTAAHYMEEMGLFRIHWPPLFPNIRVPECGFGQLDVSVGSEFPLEQFYVESGDDDKDEDAPNVFYHNKADDEYRSLGDNYTYAGCDEEHEQQKMQQQIQPSNDQKSSCVDDDWVNVNDIDHQWVDVVDIVQHTSTRK